MGHRWAADRRPLGIAVTLCAGLLMLSGCAAAPILPESSPRDRGQYETAPIPLETMEWLNNLQLSLFGDPNIEVVVQPADFRPGDLQTLIVQVMQPGTVPGVQLTMGGVRTDGSGMDFAIAELPAGLNETDVAALIAAAIQRTDVPITVRVGSVVPATSG